MRQAHGTALSHIGQVESIDIDEDRGSEPPARIVMPDFALRDYRGSELRSANLRGCVVLLTFLDAQCKESCPVIAAQIGHTFRRMVPELRASVTAVAISTGPDEDTTGPCAASFCAPEPTESCDT